MAKTRYRKPVQFVGVMSAGTVDCASLAISTTLDVPAQMILMGTVAHGSQLSDLKGAFLSFNIDGATSASLTHGLGTSIAGWIKVNQSNAATAVLYCSDLVTSTTTLVLCSNGSNVGMVFAFP